jgi:hypothetical protein
VPVHRSNRKSHSKQHSQHRSALQFHSEGMHLRQRKPPYKGRADLQDRTNEAVKSIVKLGESIGIAHWEIKAFIRCCKSKNCLKKGQQILSEYAELMDDIYTLLTKRNSYLRKFMSALAQPDQKLLNQLPFTVKKLAEYSLKSWISVCRWRQLQWTPRPISVDLNGDKSSATNFHLVFQSQVQLVLASVRESRSLILESGVEMKHFIIYLISASIEHLRPHSILTEIFSLNQAVLLAPYHELIDVFALLFAEESSSYSTWCQFNPPSPTNGSRSSDQNEVFPVLAIRYSDIVPPSRSNSDQHFHDLYSRSTHSLLSYFYRNYSRGTASAPQLSSHDNVLAMIKRINEAEINSQNTFASYAQHLESNHQEIPFDDSQSASIEFSNQIVTTTSTGDSQYGDSDLDDHGTISPPLREYASLPSSSLNSPRSRRSLVFPEQIKRSESERRPFSSGGELKSKIPTSSAPTLTRLPNLNQSPEKSQTISLFSRQCVRPNPGKVLDVAVPLFEDDRFCLKVIRDRVNSPSGSPRYQFLIQGYLDPCPVALKADCQIGDEILSANGVHLEGKSMSEVERIFRPPRRSRGAVPLTRLRLRRSEHALGSHRSMDHDDPQKGEPRDAGQELEDEIRHIENQIREATTMGSFMQLKEKLIQKIEESRKFSPTRSILPQDAVAQSVPDPPSSDLLIPSPNLRSGATGLRKSIIKNQLQREGSLQKILGDPTEAVPTYLSLRSQPFQKRSRRDSDESSRGSLMQYTPISSKSVDFHFFPEPERFSRLSQLTNLSASYSSSDSTGQRRKYLSKSALFTLREALKGVTNIPKGPQYIFVCAATRIQIWWRLVFPQKKLYHARWVKDLCREWLYELFDWAYEKTIQGRRIRRQIMREGAALKIQRRFRLWKRTVLSRFIQIQRFWRRSRARKSIRLLVNRVRAGLRIARFLFHLRRHRRLQPAGKRQIYKRVLRGFLETIGIRLREKKMKELNQTRTRNSNPGKLQAASGRRHQLNRQALELSKQRNRAVTRIQSTIRRRLAVILVTALRRERQLYQQLCLTKVFGKMATLIKRHKKKRSAVIKLASAWRGCCTRWKLMIKILASYKIRSCWRSYKEYWKLKRCLRRGEIPITIVLHRLDNIPFNILTTGTLKVRVSVWWSSLLHLVEKKSDFLTVIESKSPNIVRTTSLFASKDQAVDSLTFGAPSVQPTSRRVRKLSLTEQTRRLMPHESCRKLNDNDKLSEFARQHMHRRASFLPTSISSPSQRVSMLSSRLSVRLEERNPIREAEEESSSDDGSSSSDSDESQVQEEVKDLPKFSPPKPLHRLSSDNIGRDCTNFIGSNLIPDSTETVSGTTLEVAKKILQASLSLEIGTTSAPSPSRVLLKPVSRSDHETKGASSTLTNISDNIMSALKPSIPLQDHPKGAKLSVNLCDETLYIPGCHGNSVIRFDFFDGE